MLSPGYGELKERLIRLGHMGPAAASLTPFVALAALGRGMADLGVDVRIGEGSRRPSRSWPRPVRLPSFEIHTPATLDEAGGLMDRLGDDAVIYAGGTELLLVMKLGFADYGHLVDVKGIAELRRLEVDGDDLRDRRRRDPPRDRALAPGARALAGARRDGRGRRERARPRRRHTGREPRVRRPALGPATFLLAAEARIESGTGGGEERSRSTTS